MLEHPKDIHLQQQKIPLQYFDLITKVGSNGPYQKNLFYIFFLTWLISSLLLMGTSFLFLLPKTNCDQLGFNQTECNNYVCSLPQEQRSKHYLPQLVNSLSTEFGPFECELVYLVNALKMTLYAGTFVGYVSMPLITDNLGRKDSIVVSSVLTCLGIGILSFAPNIWSACVGLFLAGFGCETIIRTSTTILTEVVENTQRQKYITALMISFGVGQILIGIIYYLFRDWRTITIVFCLIPSLVSLLLVVFYLKQTPKFLIQKDPLYAVQILNKIGQINHQKTNIISISDINNIIQNQTQQNHLKTPFSVCIYKSQLKNYIPLSVAFFSITLIYFGPFIVISTLKMDIFVSQVILGLSQILAYSICYLLVERTPRKTSGLVLFTISALGFLGLSVLPIPQDCNWCLMGIMQLVLIFVARFSLCYYFAIIFLFIAEIFPLPLRGTGLGMVSMGGAMASTSSQYILPYLESKQINPMVMFTVFSMIGAISICFLPETLGKQLKEKIPEEEQEEQTNRISI